MKPSLTFNGPLPGRRPSTITRRVRVLFRLLIRRLSRVEFVETDSRVNPKVNRIRWIV